VLLQVRLRDWRDDETLWSSVLRVNPDSARAHTWLGLAAKHRGARDEAARLFRRAETLNPHDTSALVNLAVLAGESGDAAAAEALLREAVSRRPDRADAWQNLAVALRLQGREAEAVAAEAERSRLAPRW
jgi:Flp pilus assembly protein TadD